MKPTKEQIIKLNGNAKLATLIMLTNTLSEVRDTLQELIKLEAASSGIKIEEKKK